MIVLTAVREMGYNEEKGGKLCEETSEIPVVRTVPRE